MFPMCLLFTAGEENSLLLYHNKRKSAQNCLRGKDDFLTNPYFTLSDKEKLKMLHSNTDEYVDEQTEGQYQLGASLLWRRYKA